MPARFYRGPRPARIGDLEAAIDFVLATHGSHGDLHPFLSVGRALAARGHSVELFAHPYFAADAAAAGIALRPVGGAFDMRAALEDPRLMNPWRGGRLILDMLLAGVPELMAVLRDRIRSRRPDALLCHHVALGARWVAEQEGVPHAVAVLSPQLWFTKGDPIPALQMREGRVGALLGRALHSVVLPLAQPLLDRAVNRVRVAEGLPPARNPMLGEARAGDAVLGLWSRTFRERLPGDPQQGVICGFPWYDRAEAPLAPGLEEFLADGEPPIVFSLGTAVVHAAGDFYEVAAAACLRLGRRGLLLHGPERNRPRHLPPSLAAFPYAPFSVLLPRAAAAVHHGGIGSTAQALRSGRPALIVPHAHDQFNNALRAVRLGTAAMLPRRNLTVPRLERALRALLGDAAAHARAGEAAAAIGREDGAAAAARALESLAGGKERARGAHAEVVDAE